MIVGMDFGTTNSGMSVYDGRSVTVLPLDPGSPNPRVLRTAVYVTNEQAIHVGREAVDRYFQQNIGRAVKLRKVWIGELEVYAEDMYYVTDAYAYVDVLSPGRLFLSAKSSLRDENYPGTVVGQNYYALENLIALYMTVLKTRAEQQLGRDLRRVVLGRPVRFAADPERDRLAQARLLQAAFRAGYEQVYLQLEPVAAAFSYETTLEGPQNVLIFDFGGGTLDLTIMRLGDPRRRTVLATGGIPVAGDVFDQRLVRAKLPRHFGEGSYYGPRHKALTVPQWIYDSFSDWQKLLELQTAENRKILKEIAQTAQRRYQIEALLSLVSSNYSLKMFDIVERAKRRLSEKRGAEILLDGPGFHVREFVTRTEFESLIRAEIRAIDEHVDEVVAASGLQSAEIDAVIRTGGSSQVPVFREMLAQKFGAEKVLAIDTFSSVTAGLGVIGHGIAAGEVKARMYTPEDISLPPSAAHQKPTVAPINLDILRRRIAVSEGATAGVTPAAEQALVLVGGPDLITAVPLPAVWQEEAVLPLAELDAAGTWRQALVAELDETLLIITSHYRFLLAPPRHLAELQQIGLQLADQHRLVKMETVTAVARWRAITSCPKMLLVTSQGLARPYPMNVMQENIEAPTPLRFDHPLPGVVVAIRGMDEEEWLVAGTENGRFSRYATADLRLSGTQVINCDSDDRVTAALLVEEETELALVTADGYGRRLPSAWIQVPPKPNRKGRSLIARRSPLAALVPVSPEPCLLTNTRLLRAEFGHLLREDSTKTKRFLKLGKGEAVLCAVNGR